MNGAKAGECSAMELRGELREMAECLEKILTELQRLNMTLKACLGVCLAMEQERGRDDAL